MKKSNQRILVVDDVFQMRKTLISNLKIDGYSNITSASNGKELLNMI